MAVPSLPSAKNTNDILDNSWVDAVYDGLEFHREAVPALRVTVQADSMGGDMSSIADATTTDIEFSDGASGFTVTPTNNVGGWTAAGSGHEEILVPETGLYWCSVHARWYANSTGYRSVGLTDDGSSDSTLRSAVDTAGSTGSPQTYHGASGLRKFTANDRIGAQVHQNSGGVLGGYFTLHVVFVCVA